MSAAELERELSEYLENSGYDVVFRMGGHLHVHVFYGGRRIAELDVMVNRRQYQRGARKAKRVIRDHKKAMAALAGLVREAQS